MIIEAPAKVNLTLEVTGVEENGYHTLDTLFAWLELHDTVELRLAEETSLKMLGDAPGQEHVTADEENLVLRALRALESRCARELPTEIVLTKRIPTGGGLGGGSADAAATLWGLNSLHDLGLDQEALSEVARKLGADVAFGLVGGFARGTVYGDRLEPQPFPSELAERVLVLVQPGFPCFTPKVYGEWDRLRPRPALGATESFLKADSASQQLDWVLNDLEPAAFALFPQLIELKSRMQSLGLEGCCLSGSGSTLFGFLPPGGSQTQVEKGLSTVADVRFTKLRRSARRDV